MEIFQILFKSSHVTNTFINIFININVILSVLKDGKQFPAVMASLLLTCAVKYLKC